jgi:hypothetical protein
MKGGHRPGAGRKPGSLNRLSRKAREEATATGELPHEFLLRVVRGAKIDGHTPTFAERVDAAKAAAPYFAPRFSVVAADVSKPDDPIASLLAEIAERGKFLPPGAGKDKLTPDNAKESN